MKKTRITLLALAIVAGIVSAAFTPASYNRKTPNYSNSSGEPWHSVGWPAADQDISHYVLVSGSFSCTGTSVVCVYVEENGVIKQALPGVFSQP